MINDNSLHDLRDIAFELKEIKKMAGQIQEKTIRLEEKFNQLYEDLMKNGSVVFMERRNNNKKEVNDA